MPEGNTAGDAGPLISRPVVLLLLDGWGVAPLGEANAFSGAKTPVFLELTKEYPVALLDPGAQNLNARYLSLGAGRPVTDENEPVETTLSAVLSASGRTQSKIAETERFAALTHFFNGHAEQQFAGESWQIISSEAGDKTDKPLLALKRTAKAILAAVEADPAPDFIAAAMPYLDRIASSGDLDAIQKAIAALDKYLHRIWSAVAAKHGILIVTAAGGNVERFKNLAIDLADKNLTNNPVPLIIAGPELAGRTIGLAEPPSSDLSLLAPAGTLADLAPTILDLLGLAKPATMTGESLLR
ncbi:MAG: hypothetical protein WC453_03700 [Patescibacteria group bacterium]